MFRQTQMEIGQKRKQEKWRMTGSAVNEVLSEDEIHVEFIVLYQNLVLEKLPCANQNSEVFRELCEIDHDMPFVKQTPFWFSIGSSCFFMFILLDMWDQQNSNSKHKTHKTCEKIHLASLQLPRCKDQVCRFAGPSNDNQLHPQTSLRKFQTDTICSLTVQGFRPSQKSGSTHTVTMFQASQPYPPQ